MLARSRGQGGGAPEKPGPKPGQRPGFSHAARPLAGAEVLVAVGGPYPGEVGEEYVVPRVPKDVL